MTGETVSRGSFNLFERGSPALLTWMRQKGSERSMLGLERLIQEGDQVRELIVLLEGSLRISTSSAQGGEQQLATLGPGSMVGEMSWLEHRPTVASVDARPGSRILCIDVHELDTLKQTAPQVCVDFYRAIAKKLALQIDDQNSWIHRFASDQQQLEPLRKVLILFSELDEKDIYQLADLGTLRRLSPGEVLLQQGAPVPALYLVLAGEAEILVTIDGQSRLVGSSRRGELLGETTMLVAERSGATATVRTLQGMELLEIQKVDLMTLLQQDPAMTARFYRAISCMLSQRSRDQLLSHQLATTSRQAEVNSGSDQLNLEQLSGISRAGLRFDWLCRQLQSSGGGIR